MIITKLKIRTIGDQCLREPSAPIAEVGLPEKMLIRSMIATMKSAQGIGLAAPQVGINRQLIVLDVGQGPLAMANPEITTTSGEAAMEEGCLSVPGQNIEITRPYQIVVRYLDIENQQREEEFTDILSRAIQHEIDHLHGKLIVDYAGDKAMNNSKRL